MDLGSSGSFGENTQCNYCTEVTRVQTARMQKAGGDQTVTGNHSHPNPASVCGAKRARTRTVEPQIQHVPPIMNRMQITCMPVSKM